MEQWLVQIIEIKDVSETRINKIAILHLGASERDSKT